MKMTPQQQTAAKRVLEVLDGIGAGLPIETAFDEAERRTARPIAAEDREYLAALMEQEKWIDRRVDRFTGRIIHFITAEGCGAKERL